MIRTMQKFAALMLMCLLTFPTASAAPPEPPPAFAAVALGNGTNAVTLDGMHWDVMSNADVAAAVAAASVTAVVDTGDSTFLLVGSMSSELEAAVLAVVTVTPVTAPTVSTVADTHPAPAKDEYRLKKTILTSGGKEKTIYKTLVVERRAGESGSEFQRRSERELGDAMDAGWESTPNP